MGFESLNDREKKILKALIDHYINTAEPVASGMLSRNYDIRLSAASIRNTLKELEEMGYVAQPHTSAGRVPTAQGYRDYVDNLLTPKQLTQVEKDYIAQKITAEYAEIDHLLSQTSRVLGKLSKQLGVTLTAKFDSAVLTRLELIPVAEKRLMVVLVIRSGLVKSILFEVQSDLPDLAINETAQVLNERLCGLTLGEIKRTIRDRVTDTNMGDPKLIRLFVEGPGEIWDFPADERIHFSGTSDLFRQPEFRNPRDMAEMVQFIEDRGAVHELLTSTGGTEGIAISIGYKYEKGGSDRLSFLSTSYDMGGVKGVVGIIGPTRMEYSKLVSLVDYTAGLLSQVFSE